MFGAIDVTSMNNTRTQLQAATDTAALAISSTDSENPNTTEATMKALAASMLAANFKGATTPTLTSFSLCTPVQTTDCATVNGNPTVTNTVSMTTSVKGSCWVPVVLPGVCTGGGQTAPVYVSNTTNIGFAANIQMNMLLDVSGSMIVGATTNDVNLISTWVGKNWSQVHYSGDSNQSQALRLRLPRRGPDAGQHHARRRSDRPDQRPRRRRHHPLRRDDLGRQRPDRPHPGRGDLGPAGPGAEQEHLRLQHLLAQRQPGRADGGLHQHKLFRARRRRSATSS